MMFFPSTLFISSKAQSFAAYLQSLGHKSIENDPDIFQITEYTIETIRQIKKFLSRTPISHPNKVVIIEKADLLNTESQNALLKNLEEPGENNYFILTSSSPSALLPTIISRCHLIRFPLEKISISKIQPLKFTQNIAQSLALSDSLMDHKDQLLIYFSQLLLVYQQKLIDKPTIETVNIIDKIIKANLMLSANVDPKATLDFFLLS